MLTSYDLLVGLTLLHERNQRQNNAVSGWSGVVIQAADKQVLVERSALVEIVTPSKITRVIDHRSWLVGLMNYEGAIIPLVELRTLMDKNNPTLGLRDRSILVLSRKSGHIGLLVDKVIKNHDFWSDDAEISSLKAAQGGFSKVIFTYDKDEIEVLDIEKLATTIGIQREAVSL